MCVICVQWLARDLERLEDPSIDVRTRDQLESDVMRWKGSIQRNKQRRASIDSSLEVQNSALQGESSLKGNRS